MQQQITLRILPSQANNQLIILEQIARSLAVPANSVTGFYILKQSIDARSRQPWVNLIVNAFINEPAQERASINFEFKDVRSATKQTIIVGAGPAGLFAALRLIELGIKPILVERGKDVRARRRDLAVLNKEGEVNPESNYCFGEGGAGTYSDGKLYTRSNKRGNIDRILQLFARFGAEEKILYQSHPHIGTNKLPQIITAMREFMLSCGAEIHFETKLTNFIVEKDTLTGIEINHGALIHADAVILATGHSARDIFELLHQNNILIEAKPFALGVRVEHPQVLIDSIQYRCRPLPTSPEGGGVLRDPALPPASYNLVEQVKGKGVFSFCMCPGGLVVPASTAPGEIVVNGMSMSRRDSPFANSGTVVAIELEDLKGFEQHGVFAGLEFQKAVEQKMFTASDGTQKAPAQRLTDFANRKLSSNLPPTSYIPGLISAPMHELLPPSVYHRLQSGVTQFGTMMRGYMTAEANVIGTESRTSAPVRIPRNAATLMHDDVQGLFPSGEGAGYAGGIISAAMDGQNVAKAVAQWLNPPLSIQTS